MNDKLKIVLAVLACMATGSMLCMVHGSVLVNTEGAPSITIQPGDKIEFSGYGVPMIVNRRILVLYDLDTIDANKDIEALPFIKQELTEIKKKRPEVSQVLYVLLKRGPGSDRSEIFRKVDVLEKGLGLSVPKELNDIIFQ